MAYVERPKLDFWEIAGLLGLVIVAYLMYSKYGAWLPTVSNEILIAAITTLGVGFLAIYSYVDRHETWAGRLIWFALGVYSGIYIYKTYALIPNVVQDALKMDFSAVPNVLAFLTFINILIIDAAILYNIATRGVPVVKKQPLYVVRL